MKTPLHRIALSSLAIAAACGGTGSGSGSNAALGKSFDYGAPAAPSSGEQGATAVAQLGMQETQSFNGAPDLFTGGDLVTFVDFVATGFFDSAGLALGVDPHAAAWRIARSPAQGASCATLVQNRVTFNNCHDTVDGIDVTLNGSISASAGTVAWTLTGTLSGTDSNGVSGNVTLHEGGALAVTLAGIKGNATSDLGGTLSGQGRTVSFGLAHAAIVDLSHTLTPSYCVTGGGLEVKRVWTQRPSGVSGNFADAGVKVAWSGCGAYTIARSR